MRHRIEDLGRLTVMLRNLLDHELFDDNSRPRRPKDYWDWFSELSDEKKDDTLRSWVYGIQDISEHLSDMLQIAQGTDPLNESVNEPE